MSGCVRCRSSGCRMQSTRAPRSWRSAPSSQPTGACLTSTRLRLPPRSMPPTVFLDVTQAAGWLPVDARRFTYVCGGAYKWLLSPRGTAFLAIRPEAVARLVPHIAGWYAAHDPWSTCSGLDVLGGDGACHRARRGTWRPGRRRVRSRIAARLRAGLDMPPSESAIVIVEHPDAADRLKRAGIRASVRAGRARLSCHLPATARDVDRALEALR